MTFDEWWETLASPGLPDWDDTAQKNVARLAWNTALEEAAKLAEGDTLNAYRGGHGEPGRLTGREYAVEIRKLKAFP